MSKAKRAKTLIPKTASQCKLDEELVEDVIDFYYNRLRKKLESLEEHRIGVPVLGTFIARKSKLQRSVEYLTKLLTENKPEDFKKIERYNLDIKLRDKQQALLDKIESDEQFIKQHKENLRKSKPDSRRNQE